MLEVPDEDHLLTVALDGQEEFSHAVCVDRVIEIVDAPAIAPIMVSEPFCNELSKGQLLFCGFSMKCRAAEAVDRVQEFKRKPRVGRFLNLYNIAGEQDASD